MRRSVMGILMHGDAAFAGQGLVYETLAMSQLIGYRTGGTVHVVVNNQIGFTTVPAHAYSGLYCTDVAKSIQSPILHVNGDDPEAVVFCARLAAEFRMQFGADVVLDIVCYRRHGHNETDEPAFTQPIMYRAIRDQQTTRALYAERPGRRGHDHGRGGEAMCDEFTATLENAYAAAQSYKPNKADWLEGHWTGFKQSDEDDEMVEDATAVPLGDAAAGGRRTRRGAGELRRQPEDRPPARGQAGDDRDRRRHRLGDRRGAGVRHAAAGRAPRAAVGRGQPARHVQPAPCRAGRPDQPERIRAAEQHRATARRRSRSTTRCCPKSACSGFEYGYTLADPRTLVLWEAQFGDFANGAQVIIDQFLASGETKWLRMSGLTLLLPHGYEGQGPEHSSARLERYLQLCAERNMTVVQPDDAGQLLPRAAPPVEAQLPQAAGADDAEIAAAPQAGGVAARRVRQRQRVSAR